MWAGAEKFAEDDEIDPSLLQNSNLPEATLTAKYSGKPAEQPEAEVNSWVLRAWHVQREGDPILAPLLYCSRTQNGVSKRDCLWEVFADVDDDGTGTIEYPEFLQG